MTYHDKLMIAISEWGNDPIDDEWLFERFRDSAIKYMSPAEAFEAINITVAELAQQVDESTATEVVETLITLARHSDTSEMHPSFLKHVPDLVKQFTSYGDYARGKLDELLCFYRLSHQTTTPTTMPHPMT